MAKATDFQNVAEDLRAAMANLASADSALKAAKDFYDKNQVDAYWESLTDADLIGDSGITKAQFIAGMTFFSALTDFFDSRPVQGDYRATVEQLRATR